MISKPAFVLLAIASAALAQSATCDGGLPYCCQSFEDASSPAAQEIISTLDTVPGTVITGPVGLNCTSVPDVSATPDVTECSNGFVCCTDNFENKLVARCEGIPVDTA